MTGTASKKIAIAFYVLMLFLALSQLMQCVNYSTGETSINPEEKDDVITGFARKMLIEGKETFRFETFGNEMYWSKMLHLDKAFIGDKTIAGSGLTPYSALAAGLKFDIDLIPANITSVLKTGKMDLDDSRILITLLQLNAVVGVKATFDRKREMISLGFTCAACHSTVDNSFAPGIGHRLDGWANRDLNMGLLISMSPDLKPYTEVLKMEAAAVRNLLLNWGPGRYDPLLLADKLTSSPEGKTGAVLNPSIFSSGSSAHNMAGAWRAANWIEPEFNKAETGFYYDPHYVDPAQTTPEFPKESKLNRENVSNQLTSLSFYRMAMPSPPAVSSTYNQRSANLGKAIFNGKAQCATCHASPSFTDNLNHSGSTMGIDNFHAMRRVTKSYRTPSIAGIWTRSKGGYYHDGRFPMLSDVIGHYNDTRKLELTDLEKRYLLEYLKSI